MHWKAALVTLQEGFEVTRLIVVQETGTKVLCVCVYVCVSAHVRSHMNWLIIIRRGSRWHRLEKYFGRESRTRQWQQATWAGRADRLGFQLGSAGPGPFDIRGDAEEGQSVQ